MEKYIFTEKFTLFPKDLYTPQIAETALKSQYGIGSGYIFKEYPYKGGEIIVAYAVPEKESLEHTTDVQLYPLAARLLEETSVIGDYNKVILHYCNIKKIAHIIISTGKELKLANSFKSDSFESSLYFLFLSIQQLQMNPRQCVIRVCSTITGQQEETIRRFFKGVEKNNLDKFILK